MMNKYVIGLDILRDFLSCVIGDQKSDNMAINNLVEECSYFSSEIHCNNYFISRSLQLMPPLSETNLGFIAKVYNLVEDKCFFLEELDSKFIEFVLGHISNTNIDLDSNLLELQEDFINRNYGKKICN